MAQPLSLAILAEEIHSTLRSPATWEMKDAGICYPCLHNLDQDTAKHLFGPKVEVITNQSGKICKLIGSAQCPLCKKFVIEWINNPSVSEISEKFELLQAQLENSEKTNLCITAVVTAASGMYAEIQNLRQQNAELEARLKTQQNLIEQLKKKTNSDVPIIKPTLEYPAPKAHFTFDKSKSFTKKVVFLSEDLGTCLSMISIHLEAHKKFRVNLHFNKDAKNASLLLSSFEKLGYKFDSVEGFETIWSHQKSINEFMLFLTQNNEFSEFDSNYLNQLSLNQKFAEYKR